MKKKNLLTAAASLALVAVIGVGATLAYFTDKTGTKTNAFGMGKVDISISDTSPELEGAKQGTETDAGVEYDDVMPGDLLSKRVAVNVEDGSAPCYVAVKVEVANEVEGSVPTVAELNGLVTAAVQAYDAKKGVSVEEPTWWPVEGEDCVYYVYNTAVSPETGKDLVLFDSIDIPDAWNNAYAGCNFSIVVSAYAVQEANVSMEDFQYMLAKGTTADGGQIEFEALN